METSEVINEIATALAKAQGEMGGASKSVANTFFKSKYADLSSVWDACREPLSKNGIAIIQSPSADGSRVTVETLMVHTSGQWMRNSLSVTAKDDGPQAVGSAITYLRRYVLQSFVGVAPEDDDAEAAQGRGTAVKPQAQIATVAPKGYTEWLITLEAAAAKGTERLQAAWKNAPVDLREHLTATAPQTWETIKARAAKALVPA